jgi:Rieske Fe-S protein
MLEDNSRREFIKKSAGALGSIAIIGTTPFLTACESFNDNLVDNKPIININYEINTNDKPYNTWLTKNGIGIILSFGRANFGVPVIVVRIPDPNNPTQNIYKCYSSMCTHNNCFGSDSYDPKNPGDTNVRPSIGFKGDAKHIVCKCHGSRFDAFDEGKVVQGPAERPLHQYPTSFDSNTGILKIFF